MSKQVALWILTLQALLFAAAQAPAIELAEGAQLTIQSDLEYIGSDIETEDRRTGEKTDSEFSFFRQTYNMELQKELFPYLSFRGGGHLELIDSSNDTEGEKTGFEEKTDRLFAELDWQNPLYTASGAYRRRNFKFDPRDASSTTFHREEYSGLWHWRPVGLPSLDVDYNRFHSWDDDDTRDSVTKLLVAKSRYNY